MIEAFKRAVRVAGRLFTVGRYRRMVVVIAVAYLAAFLAALQNITASTGPFTVTTGDPAAMFRRTGFLLFDAVALIRTPVFTLLVSPINILIGVVISLLVAINLCMTYLALRRPRACSINRASGMVGVLPALLAGGACCAPTILLILGLQATAALIAATQWMIPLALLLLSGSFVRLACDTHTEAL